jgi:hypothetical protein
MEKPFSHRLPSEATVEGMGNHALLSELGHPKAWVLTPTQHAERETGYDGSLEGYRRAVIQYKRPRRPLNEDGFSVGLDTNQHANLRKKYSQREAFYCFSDALTYDTVSQAFRDRGTGGFLRRLALVPVREIPAGIKTIRFWNEEDPEDRKCKYYDSYNGRSYEKVKWKSGHQWLDAFSKGQLGHEIKQGTGKESEDGMIPNAGRKGLSTGKENHFYAQVGG